MEVFFSFFFNSHELNFQGDKKHVCVQLYGWIFFLSHLRYSYMLCVIGFRIVLACSLTCQAQIRTRGLKGICWPCSILRNRAGCRCLLFSAAHLPLWWGTGEIKYEIHTGWRVLFRANRIRWLHKMKTYSGPVTILLILQLPPRKWPI